MMAKTHNGLDSLLLVMEAEKNMGNNAKSCQERPLKARHNMIAWCRMMQLWEVKVNNSSGSPK